MASLKFEQDDKGNDTKVALTMYSKDGEFVDLDQKCDLDGQVNIFGRKYQYLELIIVLRPEIDQLPIRVHSCPFLS